MWALDFKLGPFDGTFHGYADIEFTHMDSMPMNMKDTAYTKIMGNWPMLGVMTMPDVQFLDQNRLNLLLDLKKEKWRLHLNVQSRHLFTWDSQEDISMVMDSMTDVAGQKAMAMMQTMAPTDSIIPTHLMMLRSNFFQVQQGFLEFTVNDAVAFRAGTFLPPLGIYNDIRYITPLYATVVLPMVYENMPVYTGRNRKFQEFLPQNANFMISGAKFSDDAEMGYAVYGGYGKYANILYDADERVDSIRVDRGVGIGGKVHYLHGETILGALSLYTYEHPEDRDVYLTQASSGNVRFIQDPAGERETIVAASFQYDFLDRYKFQAEYMQSLFDERETRFGLYTRLMAEIARFSPFVMYDLFKDDHDALFENTMNRLGVGSGFRISDNLYYKLEYHAHWVTDVDGLKQNAMYFIRTDGPMAGTRSDPDAETQRLLENASFQNMIRTDLIFVF